MASTRSTAARPRLSEHDETDRQRLLSMLLADEGPLSKFIATRRGPDGNWMQLEQIAAEIYQRTALTVTRAALTNYCTRYGIPMHVAGHGGSMDAEAYREAVKHLF